MNTTDYKYAGLIIRLSIVSLCLYLTCGCKQSPQTEPVQRIDTERLVNVNKYMATKDFDIMRHFVKRKSWRMSFADEGYFYEIFDEGMSPKITDKKQVIYNCTVSLLDGTPCYEIRNKTFVVGGTEEISGLHHAMKFLGKGGKARFIFPSHLSHGLQGDFDKIPPRSILLYNVHVTEVL